MVTATSGAQYEADGITDRPVYDFAPPAQFFAAGVPSGEGVFDIRDFGAVEGANVNNQPMIQSAIQAAHDAGGGIVYIPPGTWGIAANPDGYGSVVVLDNVFVKGAGMGASELRLVDGSSGDITGLVRSQWGVETTNWGLADFTIDGNKANTTGAVDGFFTGPQPGSELTDKDVYVLRVEIEEVSRYGFDPHERTERLSIQDSVAHDNAVDGFVLDFNIDAELSGNTSFANGRHGFNFVTTAQDILMTNNVAHDNGGAGFVIQRGSENIKGSHGITLVGGASYDNAREGVLVQLANDVTVSGMDISGNGRSGVRIYGSSQVTVEGNNIHGNSQSQHDGFSEVDIAAFEDTVYGGVQEASNNLVQGNTIDASDAVQSRHGIDERAGGTTGNTVADNVVTGTTRGALSLNGEGSYNLKFGTDAADTIVGSSTQDHLAGGEGADSISGGDGDDLVEGGNGNDQLLGGKGDDEIYGSDGHDSLNGNSGHDIIDGGAGNDQLIGDAGSDWLDGGLGDDTVNAGSGDDSVMADAGNDNLNGGSGFDTLDFSSVGNGVSVNLTSKTAVGSGTDVVASFEAVMGSAFADSLTGDKNANSLSGGAGDDVLRGMGGADILRGGEGQDVFSWGAAKDVIDSGVHLGVDHVADFTAGEDKLSISGLLGTQAWSTIDDVVRVSETMEGSLISVRIGGTFQDVAVLDEVWGMTASQMHSDGLLLA